jgi:acetylornithine deacetylase
MKGFIAAALSRVPTWTAVKLRRPIHLMFSCDEEIGCLGAPSMIAAAREVLPRPAAVIVGEPTHMRVANQHKGISTLRTRVTGIEAHSSLTHRGVSAVMLAAELIAHLSEISRASPEDASEAARQFDPPYTTVSVNRIEGGTALNILAAVCEFGWDIRSLPGDVPARIRDRLAAFAASKLAQLSREGKECGVDTTVLADVPPLEAERGIGAAELLARGAAESSAESIAVPFATEGGQFQHAGWSTVICGPGSIEQAHKPDEFIDRSELAACEAFLERAAGRQCG